MNTARVRNTYAHGKGIHICLGANINYPGACHTDLDTPGTLQRHEMQIHVSEMKMKMGGKTRYQSGWCCYPSGCHTK